MRVGLGRGQGRVGGERGSGSSWESGIGYGLECRAVYGIVDLATFGIRRLDIGMIVGLDGGENEATVGVGADDVGGGGGRGWGERTLSFRLKTGRSPKNRMHLTERSDSEFRKCSK